MQGNPTVQLRNAECACLPVGRDCGFMEVELKHRTNMVMIISISILAGQETKRSRKDEQSNSKQNIYRWFKICPR